MTEIASTPAAETPAPVTETTLDAPEISKPLNSPKPYDDDMLDAYAEEEATTNDDRGLQKAGDPNKDNKKPEETKIEAEKPPAADNVEAAVVKRQINGKDVEFTVKEAIESHTKQQEFNRTMDRRLSDVSRREKAWQNDQVNFKEKIGKVIETVQNGDFVTGVRAIAKLAAGSSSLDVTKFEKLYFEQLENVRKVYADMTPEQRETYFAKRRAAEAEARTKALEDEKATSVAKTDLESRVNSLMTEKKIPPQEFWGNFKALAETEVGEGKSFSSADEITAQEVVDYSLKVRHWEKVLTASQKAGVVDEAIIDEAGRITSQYPDLTVEDIMGVLQKSGLAKIADAKTVENLNRKVGKSRLNSQASSTKKQNGKIEGYDEETLEELYRHQPKTYQRLR